MIFPCPIPDTTPASEAATTQSCPFPGFLSADGSVMTNQLLDQLLADFSDGASDVIDALVARTARALSLWTRAACALMSAQSWRCPRAPTSRCSRSFTPVPDECEEALMEATEARRGYARVAAWDETREQVAKTSDVH